jgi:hypothetical protein
MDIEQAKKILRDLKIEPQIHEHAGFVYYTASIIGAGNDLETTELLCAAANKALGLSCSCAEEDRSIKGKIIEGFKHLLTGSKVGDLHQSDKAYWITCNGELVYILTYIGLQPIIGFKNILAEKLSGSEMEILSELFEQRSNGIKVIKEAETPEINYVFKENL